MKKMALVLIILVLVGISLFFILDRNPSEKMSSWKIPSTASIFGNHSSTQNDATSPNAFVQDSINPEFQEWLSKESENVESSTKNSTEIEAQLRLRAQRLSPQEIKYLLQQSLNMAGSAKRRIFSTYLLTLAPEKTESALLAMAQAPLTFSGPQTTHSPEEALAAQERALRRMAIDSLVASARGNSSMQDQLLRQFSEIPEESLRRHAEQQLSQIK